VDFLFANASLGSRIHSFPKAMGGSPGSQPVPAVSRIEALLKATHTLGEYRLVLKQGEPFSPVVLRVHSDPVSIIGRVLEQNPKSYTKLQHLVQVASDMVLAGLYKKGKTTLLPPRTAADERLHLATTEKRVTAMCIGAALAEDDFETAYSYVVNRLAPSEDQRSETTGGRGRLADSWSWKAALQAGQYVRTARTTRPTHLGTASGNPDIRHLAQRIECLATALRIAPAAQLHEILKTFRRCEEQLDAAIKEEAASEEAWDAAGDLHSPIMPGAFAAARPHQAPGAATVSNVMATPHRPRQEDDGPVSLFDLGRATAEAAKRNLGVLSGSKGGPPPLEADEDEPRARKRDQLRDAAMGTLVSGVGWLVGASAPNRD
jgi:protein transport protein SEC39